MSLQELYCELVDSKFRMNFYQAEAIPSPIHSNTFASMAILHWNLLNYGAFGRFFISLVNRFCWDRQTSRINTFQRDLSHSSPFFADAEERTNIQVYDKSWSNERFTKRVSRRTISWGGESSPPKHTCSSVTDLSVTEKKRSPTADSREMSLEKLLELARQHDRELVLEEIRCNEIEQSLFSCVWCLHFMYLACKAAEHVPCTWLAKLPNIFFWLWSKDNNWAATKFQSSPPWSLSWFSSFSLRNHQPNSPLGSEQTKETHLAFASSSR